MAAEVTDGEAPGKGWELAGIDRDPLNQEAKPRRVDLSHRELTGLSEAAPLHTLGNLGGIPGLGGRGPGPQGHSQAAPVQGRPQRSSWGRWGRGEGGRWGGDRERGMERVTGQEPKVTRVREAPLCPFKKLKREGHASRPQSHSPGPSCRTTHPSPRARCVPVPASLRPHGLSSACALS